ncbi:MAG: Bifunctional protein HldE [Chlamydiae bacterium]|nr:Bifunctional protein HldE [Chlamydiota bacterium]
MSLSAKSSSSFREAISKKIIPSEGLASFAAKVKKGNKILVTLNGSFDLLHPGHFEMIHEASCQGDLLLILLNSDASIKAYKSPHRPIRPLEERLLQIAVLERVDFVSWFEETDPCRVLAEVQPDVHVNGNEYGEECIEADVVREGGGRLHIVSLIEGFSTTNLIKKIQSLPCD